MLRSASPGASSICLLARVAAALCVCSATAAAQQPETISTQDLKRLSIEELAELDVTSVSRRVERLADTAAAVSVVRQDDIRRTGVTALAEAMRLADGLDVARFDGRTWAITARGFNTVTANKLLVMMDGRTLYSPLSAGTFWDVQDTLLADVERIEVIRGPGGTIWGANAVNGVVNIMTRSASSTRGNAAFLGIGSEERVIASARHGGRMGSTGSYRVYGKFRSRDANVFALGADADDDMQHGQAGFRLDSDETAAARWTLQGDVYRGVEGLFDREDTDVRGGNVLGRWSRRFSAASEFQLQAYYDRTHRDVPLQFRETRDTLDLDVQHRMPLRRRHDLLVGAGFRVTTGDAIGSAGFVFDPVGRTDALVSFFAQDEVALRPGRLFLTVGSKFERNDFTGFEVQPTARLRWNARRQTLWGAVSRAVRLPTRFDTDLRLVTPAGATLLTGIAEFDSESVIAYETGYRMLPHPRLTFDLAAFTNSYDRIRSQERPERAGDPIRLGNTLNARSSGFEAAATAQVLPRWRVHTSFSYLQTDFSADAGSRDISGGTSEGNDPGFLLTFRSYLDLPEGLALDASYRHVDERPLPRVPAYSELDVRFAWMVRPGLEVSLVGQNLLHDRHPEFGTPGPRRYEFQRGFYLRSAWRF